VTALSISPRQRNHAPPIAWAAGAAVSVGTPSFPALGDFPYPSHGTTSAVHLTLTLPGTYRYTDLYHPRGGGGVIVVQ